MFINKKKKKKNKPRQVLERLENQGQILEQSKAVRGKYVVVSFLLIM